MAVPRTASTAITRTLTNAFPDSEQLGHHRMRIPPVCLEANFAVVAGVRNPYERMASHYLYRSRQHIRSVGYWSFFEYVRNLTSGRLGWWGLAADPPAVKWLRDTPYTHLLRFESLHKDWQALPMWQDAGFVPELVHNNSRPRTQHSWQSLYTREIAQLIFEHQRGDFKAFDYHRESWRRDYPA